MPGCRAAQSGIVCVCTVSAMIQKVWINKSITRGQQEWDCHEHWHVDVLCSPSHLFPTPDPKTQMVEKGGLWALSNRYGLPQKHTLLLLARAKPNTYWECRNLAMVAISRIPLMDSTQIWISHIFFAAKWWDTKIAVGKSWKWRNTGVSFRSFL